MYMFDLNWCYNWLIVAPTVPPIEDQIYTFQFIIPMGELSKIHESPSGYGSLLYVKRKVALSP